MTDIQRGIILLMQSAVTGQSYPLPEKFSLEEALPLIRTNHILTLAYTGAANCGISTKDPVMHRMFPHYLQALVQAENQTREARRIFQAFEEHNIDFLPLKGCNMRPLYPKPELRYMGDADILIRTEQYDRIRPVMEALGFQEGNETDHELVWKSQGLFVELHKHLIPSYTKDYHDYFGNGWQLAKPVSGSRYCMTAEDEFIFMFTHFAKHYRDGGAGCRYILDLWVYRQSHPELDEKYIRRELTMLRIGTFYDNILRLTENWFAGSEGDALTDFMTEHIFSSGSWDRQIPVFSPVRSEIPKRLAAPGPTEFIRCCFFFSLPRMLWQHAIRWWESTPGCCRFSGRCGGLRRCCSVGSGSAANPET